MLITVALVTVAFAAVQLVTVELGVTLEVEEEGHTAFSSKRIARGDCSAVIEVVGGEVCIASIGGADGNTSIAYGCAQGVNRGALQKKLSIN